MAESRAQTAPKHPVEKRGEQLTCTFCGDEFKDPKLLQCFHVYCNDCLQQLIAQDQQGQYSVCCPTCHQLTLLHPATDVSRLQPAFYINHLFKIRDILEKIKDSQKLQCEKCTKISQTATNFCQDCGKFICLKCYEIHTEWEELSKHEVVCIEQIPGNVKQLVTRKKVTQYCSHHEDMKLEFYCETCGELICLRCAINAHSAPEHKYDLVDDAFEKHKAEIMVAVQSVEKWQDLLSKTLEEIDAKSQELDDQQSLNDLNIRQQILQLHELLNVREAELIHQNHHHIQTKMNNLATQRNKVKRAQNKLVSCLSFVRGSLWTGSPEEVLTMKEGVMNQIKEMTDSLKPDMLLPCEHANVKVMPSPEVAQIIQQFGEVYLQCLKTDKGLEVAEIDDMATAVVHLPCLKGERSTKPVKTLSCEQVSEITKKKDCSVKKTEAIKLQQVIEELEMPYGVAINKRGVVIVADGDGHCVSIFNPAGEKLWSFGSQGSGNGQFHHPRGVALDDDDNILVVDKVNNRIQQFTSDGKFIRTAGEYGSKPLEFKSPRGISVHPQNKRVYVADSNNHRIQILNSDLTFSSSFGCRGSDDGQFKYPWDIAFDSIGNALVVDGHNHRILVFSAEGKYLQKFGKKGSGEGELNMPSSISVDHNNVVYVTDMGNSRVSVFTHDGKFLTSFGTEGSEPGQFDYARGIAVDKNRVIYVSDKGRLQLFQQTHINYIV